MTFLLRRLHGRKRLRCLGVVAVEQLLFEVQLLPKQLQHFLLVFDDTRGLFCRGQRRHQRRHVFLRCHRGRQQLRALMGMSP